MQDILSSRTLVKLGRLVVRIDIRLLVTIRQLIKLRSRLLLSSL